LHDLPGPPSGGALPRRRRQAPDRRHAQRHAGHHPLAGGDPREPPAGRRLRGGARGAAAVRGQGRARTVALSGARTQGRNSTMTPLALAHVRPSESITLTGTTEVLRPAGSTTARVVAGVGAARRGRAARTVRSRVLKPTPPSTTDAVAYPSAESTQPETIPPWTVPPLLSAHSAGVAVMTISPSSADVARR